MYFEISDKEFEDQVSRAIDSIPARYADKMKNVGFVIEDEPSWEQRQKLHLVNGMTLYGLYEGVPLTARTNNYSGVLPDKITIFKNPIISQAQDTEQLCSIIKNTVWHEVAHHFGLGHNRINELENK